MLKVAQGLGANIIDAQERAIEEYNKVEGQITYHEHEFIQLKDTETNADFWACCIWYTVRQTDKQRVEAAYDFIGSHGVNPNDPDWQEKLAAMQAFETAEETDIRETAETDWFLNTEEYTPVASLEGSGATEIENPYSDMDELKNNNTELPTEKSTEDA